MGQAIGIDFGTTNTIVSYKWHGRLRTFRSFDVGIDEIFIPNLICFETRDKYFIGERAIARQLCFPDPCVANFSSKLDDKDFFYKVKAVNGDEFKLTPRMAVKLFLSKIIIVINEFLRREGVIDRVVIAVPPTFKPIEIDSIKKVASNLSNALNLKVRVVFAPIAEAVAAMEEDRENVNKVLIYHLDDATFDVSLIQRDSERNKFKHVLPADGDKNLGGNLFTEMLAEKLLTWANEEYGTEFKMDYFDRESHHMIHTIRQEANRIKEELSDTEEEDTAFSFYTSKDNLEEVKFSVTRKEFEKLIKKKVLETVNKTYKMILSPQAQVIGGIDKIVLVGSSSNIPLIKNLLSEKLNREIKCSDEVSTLASRGAAILAQDIKRLDDIDQLDDIEQVTGFKIYTYLAEIDRQRTTIDAQQKSIQELQKLVKDLTERLSAIEEKINEPKTTRLDQITIF